MSLHVVGHGQTDMLNLVLAEGYLLKLYANDVSLADSTTAGDLDEADFTGYDEVELDGGSWSVSGGDPAVGVYSQQSFTSTADQAAETIYGYYVVRASDGRLQWAEAFGSPIVVQFNNDSIRVTARLTLNNEA